MGSRTKYQYAKKDVDTCRFDITLVSRGSWHWDSATREDTFIKKIFKIIFLREMKLLKVHGD
jgi:hypothetical protein